MPYDITKDTNSCPVSKPYAVKKRDDKKLIGCHTTEQNAQRQLAALEAKENGSAMDQMIRRAASR